MIDPCSIFPPIFANGWPGTGDRPAWSTPTHHARFSPGNARWRGKQSSLRRLCSTSAGSASQVRPLLPGCGPSHSGSDAARISYGLGPRFQACTLATPGACMKNCSAGPSAPSGEHLRLFRWPQGIRSAGPPHGRVAGSPCHAAPQYPATAGRHHGSEHLVRGFADISGRPTGPERRPQGIYDPRALDREGPGGVLHAKAVVADDEAVFVTSANLTEAALDRNIELGVLLSRDRALAASLATPFAFLIERELLRPLPGSNQRYSSGASLGPRMCGP